MRTRLSEFGLDVLASRIGLLVLRACIWALALLTLPEAVWRRLTGRA
jgi:hypothetical protein